MSTQAREAMYRWQYPAEDRSSFSYKLMDLIAKSDRSNRERLRLGFPEHLQAFEEWESSKDPDALFEQWGYKVWTR